ncbi:MAG: hypothetical protein EOO90_10490 [Pedobacter sp.]|nr:MAG: hypothetical protein EOO90_10490 [Pedobacter sp.]
MRTKYLLPQWSYIMGWIMALPGFVLGYLFLFKKYEIPGFGFRMRDNDGLLEKAFENFTNELAIVLVIVGLLCIAFSKRKQEDELTSKMRLSALHWGVITYYLIYVSVFVAENLLVSVPFIVDHYLELNIFTPLLIFIARFSFLKLFNRDIYLVGNVKLLPNRPVKKIGIVLTLLSLSIAASGLFSPLKYPFSYPLIYICFVFGLLLWSFSKYKIEDEMTKSQRLESLQLAVYFNYFLLLIATLFTYSLDFLSVLAVANFSPLVFFVMRMEYINYRNMNSLRGLVDEK